MQTLSVPLKLKQVLVLGTLLFVSFGCSRSNEKDSRIFVQFPALEVNQPALQKKASAQSTASGDWGLSDPASLANINCYAIAIGGPEPEMQSKECHDSSRNTVFRAGVIAGLFKPNAIAPIDVSSGSRTIYIVGFSASSEAACSAFKDGGGPSKSLLSAPHVIGQQTVNLEPGENTVSISVSIAGARKFDDCTGMNSNTDSSTTTTTTMPSSATTTTTTTSSTTTTTVPPTFTKVESGGGSTCGLKSNGSLSCWGSNAIGQVGDGTTTDRLSPVIVNSGVTYQAIAVGSNGGYAHSCGITTSSALKCWGWNADGALGDGTTTNRSSPVVIDSGMNYSSVAVGGNGTYAHTCGITASGVLKCWGSNNQGQLGDASTTARNSPVVINSGTTYFSVSVGDTHTCGITTAGVLKCWGANSYGQLGDGSTTYRNAPVIIDSGVTYAFVEAGSVATCAITSAGVLKCWGAGYLGSGSYLSTQTSPLVIDSGTNYSSVSVGGGSICGITTSSALKCWGTNGFGEAGDGTTATISSPMVTDSGVSYAHITQGSATACGVTSSGVLKCWGDNSTGEYGDGTTTSSNMPIAVN